MDLIGQTLWERLHHFEAFVKDKKQALGQELEALGKGPQKGADLAERGKRIAWVLAAKGAWKYLMHFASDTRQRLASLLTLRYGAHAAIGPLSEAWEYLRPEAVDCKQ